MTELAAAAVSVALTVWAVAAWDIMRKWVQEKSAATLFRHQADFERLVSTRCDQFERAVQQKSEQQDARIETNKKAIENLAKEIDQEMQALRAQQVGVLSGMGGASQRRRFP